MKQQVTDVAIVGAGPYGLSIAAQLRSRDVTFRIFGKPMSTWRNHMPGGTFLKSFGCASSLYNPGSPFTLEDFCREQGITYSEELTPVSLETFIAYGMEFQRRFIPELEDIDITSIQRTQEGFALTTQTGEVVLARRVILAVGITHFGHMPLILANLPGDLVSHSSEHEQVAKFAGRRVAVLGAGASAGDLAGLLHEAGAQVHLMVRSKAMTFQQPPSSEPRSLIKRMLKPRSGLGHGWRGFLCTHFPLVFHRLPEKIRRSAVQTVNGPAPAWFARDKVIGHVPMHLGVTIKEAVTSGDGVLLKFSESGGALKELQVDHVIAATGYQVAVQRLGFLDDGLRRELRTVDGRPILGRNFESSVPGLYMVGLASAASFGPLCRFAYGAKFTSKHIARHLAETAMQSRIPSKTNTG